MTLNPISHIRREPLGMVLLPLVAVFVIGLCMSEDKAAQLQSIARIPMFGMLGLVFVWKLFGPICNKIFQLAVSLTYPGYCG